MALGALAVRERLIARLAALVGLRPGEVFALQWRHIDGSAATIRQRVYRGIVDTVKNQRPRVVALPGTVTSDQQMGQTDKWFVSGAGDGDRTRDVQLGKLTFYR